MKVKTITSIHNEVYKNLLKLKRQRRQQEENVFLVEGMRSFQEVVKAKDYTVESIWMDEKTAGKLSKTLEEHFDCPLYAVPSELLIKASETVTSQGILLVVRRKKQDLEAVMKKHPTLAVILERIQDPGNMGTILRTADAAGCGLVFVTNDCVDEYSSKVVRSAMGSLLHVPVFHVESAGKAAALLKEAGFTVVAGALTATALPYDINMVQPVAVMIGNEGAGLSEEAMEAADILVKLPMIGRAESLNASVAAGVLLYEAVRQRVERSRSDGTE